MAWDDVNQSPELVQILKDFSKCPRGFLLMAGKNGTGKTYAAQKIYIHYRYRHPIPLGKVIYEDDMRKMYTQAELNIEWINHQSKWDTTNHLLNELINCELLVLDDIGTRTPSEAFMDFLYCVVDNRYRRRENCGTVITTNFNSAMMREKFGDAFVSRVAYDKVYRFEGPDRRFKDF